MADIHVGLPRACRRATVYFYALHGRAARKAEVLDGLGRENRCLLEPSQAQILRSRARVQTRHRNAHEFSKRQFSY